MITWALLCYVLVRNIKEKTMKQNRALNAEIFLYSYSIGFLYLLFCTEFCTKVTIRWKMINWKLKQYNFNKNYTFQHPLETYWYTLLFSVSGYLGIQVVLSPVKSSGAFVATTVTTWRKAVTIIILCIVYFCTNHLHFNTFGLV